MIRRTRMQRLAGREIHQGDGHAIPQERQQYTCTESHQSWIHTNLFTTFISHFSWGCACLWFGPHLWYGLELQRAKNTSTSCVRNSVVQQVSMETSMKVIWRTWNELKRKWEIGCATGLPRAPWSLRLATFHSGLERASDKKNLSTKCWFDEVIEPEAIRRMLLRLWLFCVWDPLHVFSVFSCIQMKVTLQCWDHAWLTTAQRKVKGQGWW